MRSRRARTRCSRSRACPATCMAAFSTRSARDRGRAWRARHVARRGQRRRKADRRARYPAGEGRRRSCAPCCGLARDGQRGRVRRGGAAGDGRAGRGQGRRCRATAPISRRRRRWRDRAVARAAEKLGERQSVFSAAALHEEAGRIGLGKVGYARDRRGHRGGDETGRADRPDLSGPARRGVCRVHHPPECRNRSQDAADRSRGARRALAHRLAACRRQGRRQRSRRKPSVPALAGMPISAPRPSSC